MELSNETGLSVMKYKSNKLLIFVKFFEVLANGPTGLARSNPSEPSQKRPGQNYPSSVKFEPPDEP